MIKPQSLVDLKLDTLQINEGIDMSTLIFDLCIPCKTCKTELSTLGLNFILSFLSFRPTANFEIQALRYFQNHRAFQDGSFC